MPASFSTLFSSIIAVVQILHFLRYLGQICIKIYDYLASNYFVLLEQHFLVVIFGINLVSNIGTEASKKHHI
jgi:hypothetical protein